MSKKLKTPLKLRVSALAVASCLGAFSGIADAAGLGRITVFSALGQPLRAEIEVNAAPDEVSGMVARMATPESFRQAGLEYAGALSSVRVALDKRSSGQPYIRLTSDRPLSEPFFDVLLELNWSSGRLVREYTFLLDPPEINPEKAASAPVMATPVVAEKTVDRTAEKVIEKPAERVSERPAEQPVSGKEVAPATEKAPKAEEPKLKKTTSTPTPAGGGDGQDGQRQVKQGDTLSRIAREAKIEGVALEQVLIGLFRANPDAFQGKNMNRLKAGKILTMPSKESLEEVAAPAARKEVIAQAQDWNAYRRKLAGVTAQEPVAEAPAQAAVAGKITAKVEDKAAKPVDNKDQVKVSKAVTPGTQPPAVKKASEEEERVAREKALKDSADRVAQLEKNVNDLKTLADLKNKQLAQTQATAKPADSAPVTKAPEAAKPATPATPATPTVPVVETKPAAPVVAAPTGSKDPAAPSGPAPVAAPGISAPTAAAPALTPAPDAAKPADTPMPKPKPKAPPPPPVEEDGGLLPMLAGAVAVLVAGIGGLVFYRRRKAANAGEMPVVSPSLGEASLGANSVFRATGGQSIDTSAATPAVTDFSQTGPGAIDTDEVDPVAEAEVYMAYGRDAQAEEILLEALQKDSKRLAIHLKLLEIYSQRKSAKQFETLATELYSQTGGNGVEWEKAVAMGAKLDPANPLYSSGSGASPFAGAAAVTAAASSFNPDATVVASSGMTPPAAPVSDISFDLDVGDLPQFGEAPAPAFSPSETVVKGAPELPKSLASDLDFDLDLGGIGSAPVAEAKPVDLNAGGLDFDLKLGDSLVAPHLDEVPMNKPDLSSISLDLDQSSDNAMAEMERTMFAVPGAINDTTSTNILGSGMGGGGGNALEQAVATNLWPGAPRQIRVTTGKGT